MDRTNSYLGSSYFSEKKKEIEEQKRIFKEQEEEKSRNIQKFLNSHPPSLIEAELNEYIIDQPSLTKKVADFLYYQALRYKYPDLHSRPLLICGPSGSGKTEVWRVAKKLYSEVFKIIFINAANITSDGWSGSNKLVNYLTRNIVRNSKSRLSVIADLLNEHGIDAWKDLSDDVIMKMIQSSDIGKFGVRSVLSKIETIMLSLIHEKGLVNLNCRTILL